MFKSEKNWRLKVNMNNVYSDGVKPERKSLSGIFTIASEQVTFDSIETMSPFNFDTFRLTFTSIIDADSIKVGLSVM